MKKIIALLSILLGVVSVGFAQFEAGQKMITGGLSNSYNGYVQSKQNSLNANISVTKERFLSPLKSRGFIVGYGIDGWKTLSQKVIGQNISLGMTSSRYMVLKGKLLLFGRGTAQLGFINRHETRTDFSTNIETDYNFRGGRIYVSAFAGLMYRVSSQFSFSTGFTLASASFEQIWDTKAHKVYNKYFNMSGAPIFWPGNLSVAVHWIW